MGCLTKRECEVAKLLINGYTYKEIAKILIISPATVISHRRRILCRLGARNTAHAAALLVRAEYEDRQTLNLSPLL